MRDLKCLTEFTECTTVLVQICTMEVTVPRHCRLCRIHVRTVGRWVYQFPSYWNTLGHHMVAIQGLLLQKW